MRYRHSLLTLLTLAISSLAVACQRQAGSASIDDPWGVVQIPSGNTLHIGVAISTTSNAVGPEGLELVRGIELASRQYDNIKGFPIELVVVDTDCSASGGESAAAGLLGDSGVVGVIGPNCSSACQTSATAFDEAHYTMISPSCGASGLTDPVTHVDAFLRTIYPDILEGELAARYAYRELGARKAAIIYDGSPETADMADAFEVQFTGLGGEIVAKDTIVSGDQNLSPILDAIAFKKPDLIYAPLLLGDAVTLTNQRSTTALASTSLLGGRHYWSDWFISVTGRNAEGVYAIGPYITTSAYTTLNSTYRLYYNRLLTSPVYAYAYDAASLLLETLQRVAVTGSDGSLLIGRKALQEALYSTTDYSGVTGNMTCSAWGDCGAESIAVGHVLDGAWITVYIP